MQLLVLGGTRFVGRAIIDDALARGWQVSALTRGVTGTLPTGVTALHADRTDPAALRDALGDTQWDAAVDTWSGAPAVAASSAQALRGQVGRLGYVSSKSVYRWGEHVDEHSPVIDASAYDVDGQYPQLRRGAERAVTSAFPDAVLARAGLILGPHEDIGRLPWWLSRMPRGGRVVAPGRPDRPLQYVDARDLAAWLLDAVAGNVAGPVDVASRSGHATTLSLLDACIQATDADVELVWFDEDVLAAAGAQPWTELPCWVPESGEFAGFLEGDTSLAAATGLRCRPVIDTVLDTWRWLQRDGRPAQRADRDVHGLPTQLEQRLLAERPAQP